MVLHWSRIPIAPERGEKEKKRRRVSPEVEVQLASLLPRVFIDIAPSEDQSELVLRYLEAQKVYRDSPHLWKFHEKYYRRYEKEILRGGKVKSSWLEYNRFVPYILRLYLGLLCWAQTPPYFAENSRFLFKGHGLPMGGKSSYFPLASVLSTNEVFTSEDTLRTASRELLSWLILLSGSFYTGWHIPENTFDHEFLRFLEEEGVLEDKKELYPLSDKTAVKFVIRAIQNGQLRVGFIEVENDRPDEPSSVSPLVRFLKGPEADKFPKISLLPAAVIVYSFWFPQEERRGEH